nr:DNA-3-methyladenine glycosylase [Actinomyces massiliensis]
MPGGRDMAGGGSGLTPDVAEVLARDSLQAAPALLGAIVTTMSPEGTVSVRLTEVEAYRGEADPGSHAFRGRTARNASMFEAGGIIYVYFTYGMHHCVNVVTGPEGLSRAVLMRGGEVVAGVELARRRRPAARNDRDLARGPARLCAALGLDRSDDGTALGGPGSRVSLALPEPGLNPEAARIRTGPRTGVAGPGGDGEAYPWRFWLEDEPTVSPYKPAVPRRRAGRAER